MCHYLNIYSYVLVTKVVVPFYKSLKVSY